MRIWQNLLRQSWQDELASVDNFLLYESPKKKLKSILEIIGVSPVNIHGVAQYSCDSNVRGKLENGFKCVQGEHFCCI